MYSIDVVGLFGFSISGFLFVASALSSGDAYALAGSLVWIVSCLAWIVALLVAHKRARSAAARLRNPSSSGCA